MSGLVNICSASKNTFCFPAVYLGVTNLSTYQVRMNGLCAQWQPHRHASAYRVALESLVGEYSDGSVISKVVLFPLCDVLLVLPSILCM